MLWSHFSSRSSSEWPSFHVPKGLDPGSCTAETYRPPGGQRPRRRRFNHKYVLCGSGNSLSILPALPPARLPITHFPHGDVNPKITSEASTRALATWVARKFPALFLFVPLPRLNTIQSPCNFNLPCALRSLFAWLFAYALPSRSLSQLVPPSSEYSETCLPFSSTAGQSIGDRHRGGRRRSPPSWRL